MVQTEVELSRVILPLTAKWSEASQWANRHCHSYAYCLRADVYADCPDDSPSMAYLFSDEADATWFSLVWL